MLVQLRVDDELYQKYAKRNPGDPRKALEETLVAHQDLEPGVPRVVVANPELRDLNRVLGASVNTPAELINLVKRHQTFSLAGVEVELSLSQRQRLAQMAAFMNQPLEEYIRQQIGTMVLEKIGA